MLLICHRQVLTLKHSAGKASKTNKGVMASVKLYLPEKIKTLYEFHAF